MVFSGESYGILYHPQVLQQDLPSLSAENRQRIRKAIERKIVYSPEQFGEPLRRTLKGYWKLRVGDYRIIYKLQGKSVLILKIGHRREVYEKAIRS